MDTIKKLINPMFSFLDAKIPFWRQFVKFGIVGVSNTAIGWGVYYLLVLLFDLRYGVGLQIANFVSFLVSVAWAYLWNYVWVFKKEAGAQSDRAKKTAPFKFYSAYLFSYIVSALLLSLWVDVLHLDRLIAPVLNLFVTVPLNFLLSKLWIFRKAK